MEAVVISLHMINGSRLYISGCDDEESLEYINGFKNTPRDGFFEFVDEDEQLVCIPMANILYVTATVVAVE